MNMYTLKYLWGVAHMLRVIDVWMKPKLGIPVLSAHSPILWLLVARVAGLDYINLW